MWTLVGVFVDGRPTLRTGISIAERIVVAVRLRIFVIAKWL
jgi:hypothetical protein